MLDLLIRDVPEEVARELSRLAGLNNLSRQEFVRTLLVDYVSSKCLASEDLELERMLSTVKSRTGMLLEKNKKAIEVNGYARKIFKEY